MARPTVLRTWRWGRCCCGLLSVVGSSPAMSLSPGVPGFISLLVPKKHPGTQGPGLGRGETGHSEGPEGPREERLEQWLCSGST